MPFFRSAVDIKIFVFSLIKNKHQYNPLCFSIAYRALLMLCLVIIIHRKKSSDSRRRYEFTLDPAYRRTEGVLYISFLNARHQ